MDHRELWRADSALVRQLRRERGWSRQRLADVAGVSHHTVAKVERGETVFPATLHEIAAALGLTAGDLTCRAEAAPELGPALRSLTDSLRDRYSLYNAAIRGGGFELMRREFPKGLSRTIHWTYASTRDLSKIGAYPGHGGVIRFFEQVFTGFQLGDHHIEQIVPVEPRALLARGTERFSVPGVGEVMSIWMHLCKFDRRGRLVACHCSTDVRPIEPAKSPAT